MDKIKDVTREVVYYLKRPARRWEVLLWIFAYVLGQIVC